MTEILVYSSIGFILGFVYKHLVEMLHDEITKRDEEVIDVLDEIIQEIKPCDTCKDKTTRLEELKKELKELESENDRLLEAGDTWLSVFNAG
jgi:uncharacterized protein Yka (UPF0111/DUF47 family)